MGAVPWQMTTGEQPFKGITTGLIVDKTPGAYLSGSHQSSDMLPVINANPLIDPLRIDPRFVALIEKIGLAP